MFYPRANAVVDRVVDRVNDVVDLLAVALGIEVKPVVTDTSNAIANIRIISIDSLLTIVSS